MDVLVAEFAHAPAEPVRTSYRPVEPISLTMTLGPLGRGPHDPTMVWDAVGLWRTFRTPDGPATMRLTPSRGGVDAIAWGPGAEWSIAGLPELLGRDDDWSALDVSAHPLLREVRRRAIGLRLTRTRRVLEALIPAVIEQRVPSIEAYRAWAKLVRDHGEPAPGPAPLGMCVVPTSEQWRRIPSWAWHEAGVDPGRSRTAIRAAGVASGLERTLAPGIQGEEAARRLRSLPGIGAWTAAETLQRSHGDPDVVSVGDYHLANYVGTALTGSRVDDDGMLELLEPWAGQRQRVIRLILASGYREPRRGPRVTLQDHRRH